MSDGQAKAEQIETERLSLDETRFRNRGTAGRMALGLASLGIGAGQSFGARLLASHPARDVDGLGLRLEELERAVKQLQTDNTALHAEIANTRERVARIERLLAESWGTK